MNWGQDVVCHIADNIFKLIFVYKTYSILIQTSVKFVPKRSIDIYPWLVWCQAIIWTNVGLVHWSINVTFSSDEVKASQQKIIIGSKYYSNQT